MAPRTRVLTFDSLHDLEIGFQVETIGDAYMVVSGAPMTEDNHAEKVCDMALDMVDAITDLKDPSTGKPIYSRRLVFLSCASDVSYRFREIDNNLRGKAATAGERDFVGRYGCSKTRACITMKSVENERGGLC